MEKNEKKNINKRLEQLKLESLCLADFIGRLLKILGATLFDDRGYLMRINSVMR